MLRLASRGYSNADIARILFISLSTVAQAHGAHLRPHGARTPAPRPPWRSAGQRLHRAMAGHPAIRSGAKKVRCELAAAHAAKRADSELTLIGIYADVVRDPFGGVFCRCMVLRCACSEAADRASRRA